MPPPPWDLDAEPPDIAVLVVLAEEFATLAERYGSRWFARPNQTYGGSDYFWIELGYRCVASFAGRMSPEEAVHVTNRLLAHRPATIVNLGIAAALHADIKIGDVVVPDLVVAYDKTTKVRPVLGADGRELADDWLFERREKPTRDLSIRVTALEPKAPRFRFRNSSTCQGPRYGSRKQADNSSKSNRGWDSPTIRG